MWHRSLVGQRLLALFLLGWVVFNYPFLALLEDAGDFFGLPASYVCIFGIWALLIALMGWAADHGARQRPRHDPEPEPKRRTSSIHAGK